MFRGELVEQGTAQQIFADPHHPYTKHLLGSVPYLGRPRPAAMEQVPAPPVGAEHVVEIRDLDVFFPGRIGSPPVQAVKGVSLDLRKHEI
jgi:peptide/nickel transport system ATP-binding protein